MNATKEYINIHRLIKESDSKLLKRLPNFIIYLIKLIIRQNEINRILSAYADYEGVEFLSKIKDELNIKIELKAWRIYPKTGNAFLWQTIPLVLLTVWY